jgi:hypothetical protein
MRSGALAERRMIRAPRKPNSRPDVGEFRSTLISDATSFPEIYLTTGQTPCYYRAHVGQAKGLHHCQFTVGLPPNEAF